MRSNKLIGWFVGGAALLAFLSRLLPHTPNFTPVGALALFAGAYLPWRKSLLVPILVLVVSDVWLGFYDYRLMLAVYSGFLVMVAFGRLSGRGASPLRVGLGALSGSAFFFLLTNFAVWVFSDWYAPTLSGLLSAYAMGVPFFRTALLADLFYSTLLFGAYEVVNMAIFSRLRYTLPVRVRIGIKDTALLEKKVRII